MGWGNEEKKEVKIEKLKKILDGVVGTPSISELEVARLRFNRYFNRRISASEGFNNKIRRITFSTPSDKGYTHVIEVNVREEDELDKYTRCLTAIKKAIDWYLKGRKMHKQIWKQWSERIGGAEPPQRKSVQKKSSQESMEALENMCTDVPIETEDICFM